MSQMDNIMAKRQKEIEEAYEAVWDEGRGSHHPDYDPEATGDDINKVRAGNGRPPRALREDRVR